MSRWRPPAAHGTAVISRAGLLALQQELEQLWRVRRPEVVKALSAAAAEGDRSENAEYQYRKKELAGIDRRVRYLSKRIPVLRVPQAPPRPTERVYFGCRVRVEDAHTGEQKLWRLVGPDEADATRGDISIDSPLARALLGHGPGEEVRIALPAGEQWLCIESIDRPADDPDRR